MGHIDHRPDRAKPWRARYRDPSGKERSKSFTRKIDAQRFLATVEADKLRREWTDPSHGKIRFGEWSRQVQTARLNVADSTRENYAYVLRSLVLPRFGETPLYAIEPADIRQWVSDLAEAGYAPSTVRRAYTLLQEALEKAVTDQLIARSPCRDIALPKDHRTEKRFLTVDEVDDLAAAIDPRYRVFALTGAYTGLRPGELMAMRIDRLDVLRGQMRVEEPIKTPAARRTVSFPRFLADELAGHIATYPAKEQLVFGAPEGGRIRPGLFRRRIWLPAVRASVGEPRRVHDLRHTHVALLIAAGEDPYVISRRLGHASIRTTYDVYGHLFEGRDRDAADSLERIRRQSRAAQMRLKPPTELTLPGI